MLSPFAILGRSKLSSINDPTRNRSLMIPRDIYWNILIFIFTTMIFFSNKFKIPFLVHRFSIEDIAEIANACTQM